MQYHQPLILNWSHLTAPPLLYAGTLHPVMLSFRVTKFPGNWMAKQRTPPSSSALKTTSTQLQLLVRVRIYIPIYLFHVILTYLIILIGYFLSCIVYVFQRFLQILRSFFFSDKYLPLVHSVSYVIPLEPPAAGFVCRLSTLSVKGYNPNILFFVFPALFFAPSWSSIMIGSCV